MNVDLEVRDSEDLTWLAEILSGPLSNLFCGECQDEYLASFEVSSILGDASTLALILCKAVERLPEKDQARWQKTRRCLDFGFEAGKEQFSFEQAISAEALAAIVKIGASVGITIYCPSQEEAATWGGVDCLEEE